MGLFAIMCLIYGGRPVASKDDTVIKARASVGRLKYSISIMHWGQ